MSEGLVGLEARVEELTGQVEALPAFIVQLQQRLFGRKSEKRVASSGEGQTAGDAAEGSGSPTGRKRGQQRGAPGHGRRRRTELAAEVIVHDLPEEDRCCSRCGEPLRPLGGAATSAEIDGEVTARRTVHQRRRCRRTCQCSGLPQGYTAPPPPAAAGKPP